MKPLFKVTLATCAVAAICSCRTPQPQTRVAMDSRVVYVPEKDLHVTPVVCDMVVDFDKKITATSDNYRSVEGAKEDAYYKAVTENDIDVIVDPIYKITSSRSGVIAEIKGFGAVYKNPRPITQVYKELESIKDEDLKKFDSIYSSGETSSPTRRTRIILHPKAN